MWISNDLHETEFFSKVFNGIPQKVTIQPNETIKSKEPFFSIFRDYDRLVSDD